MSNSITLNYMKEEVYKLAQEKGFPNNKEALTQKLLFAFVELGEAGDAFKKGEDWEHILEECIDVMFYLVNFAGIVEKEYGITVDLDKIFADKLAKNHTRPQKYGQKRAI